MNESPHKSSKLSLKSSTSKKQTVIIVLLVLSLPLSIIGGFSVYGSIFGGSKQAGTKTVENKNDEQDESREVIPTTDEECEEMGYSVGIENPDFCLIDIENDEPLPQAYGEPTEQNQPSETEKKTVTYTSSYLGKAVTAGIGQITITKIESGHPSDEPKDIQEHRLKYIRVYFTLKNLSNETVNFGHEGFGLEDSTGKRFNAKVDIGLDEFGYENLKPGASIKAFTIFYTDTESGNILWTPPNGEDVSLQTKIDFKKVN